ncbi:uncharacterized protein LOC128789685 [Vidua chalybeata]|uniref:uncharacterized protein LOC128789685 n=1 Tax=Vidua chalybeata TaxID=81927 RepID=UPI0023A84AAF|nr:uncharacterized protein LOC128789685 [Vidua chalybeata]
MKIRESEIPASNSLFKNSFRLEIIHKAEANPIILPFRKKCEERKTEESPAGGFITKVLGCAAVEASYSPLLPRPTSGLKCYIRINHLKKCEIVLAHLIRDRTLALEGLPSGILQPPAVIPWDETQALVEKRKITLKGWNRKDSNSFWTSAISEYWSEHHVYELKYLLKYRRIQEKLKVRYCKVSGSSSQVLLERHEEKFHNEKNMQSMFCECLFLVVMLH